MGIFRSGSRTQVDTEGRQQELTFRIEPLGTELAADLETKRSWVRNCIVGDTAEFDSSWQAKARTVVGVLDTGKVGPTDTARLQALGVVFGDALVQLFDLNWVQIVDERGTDPALEIPGVSDGVIFPLTIVAKRVEKGETVDAECLGTLIGDLEQTIADLRA